MTGPYAYYSAYYSSEVPNSDDRGTRKREKGREHSFQVEIQPKSSLRSDPNLYMDTGSCN
jgi:hypothetical protein